MDLEAIERTYQEETAAIGKPFEELNAKYIAAVKKAGDEMQAAGNLDGILESKKAVADIERGDVPDGKSPEPTLAKLEQVYLGQRTEIAKSLEGARLKVDTSYITLLESLAVKLTKESRIDEAIKVREKVIAAKQALPKIAGLGTEMDPKFPVRIIAASYGSGDKMADVTARVRELVEVKRVDFAVNPGTLGTDPNPGWNKNLTVRYTKDGVERKQNRGENETLLIESFHGPQDIAEMEKWLAGTQWRHDQPITFNADGTFISKGIITAGRWSIPRLWVMQMVWSDGRTEECAFGWRWDSFAEKTGGKRIFKKVK